MIVILKPNTTIINLSFIGNTNMKFLLLWNQKQGTLAALANDYRRETLKLNWKNLTMGQLFARHDASGEKKEQPFFTVSCYRAFKLLFLLDSFLQTLFHGDFDRRH